MMNAWIKHTLALAALMVAGAAMLPHAFAQSAETAAKQRATAPEARAILDKAKAKLASARTLVVEYDTNAWPGRAFTREGEMFLERPNRYRVETIRGMITEERNLRFLSDGQTVTRINDKDFITYEQPVRKENFFLGVNFLLQFFFDSRPISFDPTDASWGRPVSAFDNNRAAYDRDVDLMYLGATRINGRNYRVVEIKYNTLNNDVRQQLYVGEDDFIYQVDTYFEVPSPSVRSQIFRNFRVNQALPPKTWERTLPAKMPVAKTDPIRMGAEGPDFTLPGYEGGEFTMKTMLQGKKGLYICTFDGTAAKYTGKADTHLKQMRVLQDMKDKFEKQGLMVVAIVGGSELTPDLKKELLLNWMPDLSRFNYPVLLDFDIERGLQGSAYPNYNMGGRNNILLDSKGKVVFAAKNFSERVNQLALYQALAQIGFTVSAADLEGR